MADESPSGKKITKFNYNPVAIDVSTFPIVVDLLHWKLLCKQALDLNTTPEHIWAMVLEGYLINTGYLDPRSPSSEGYKLPVTIRELREDPNKLFNWRQNDLLWDGKKKEDTKEPSLTTPEDDDLDLSDFT